MGIWKASFSEKLEYLVTLVLDPVWRAPVRAPLAPAFNSLPNLAASLASVFCLALGTAEV